MRSFERILDFIAEHEKCTAKEIREGLGMTVNDVQIALHTIKRGGHVIVQTMREGEPPLYTLSPDRSSPADLRLGVLRVLQDADREMRPSEVAVALGVSSQRLRDVIADLKNNQMIIKRVTSNRNTWLRLISQAAVLQAAVLADAPVQLPVLCKLAPKWMPQKDLVRFFATMGNS